MIKKSMKLRMAHKAQKALQEVNFLEGVKASCPKAYRAALLKWIRLDEECESAGINY